MLFKCLLAFLLFPCLGTGTYAATIELKTGPLVQINLPNGFELSPKNAIDGREVFGAYNQEPPSRSLEIQPITADVDWSAVTKHCNCAIKNEDLRRFSSSRIGDLSRYWTTAPNAECRLISSHPTIWQSRVGAVQQMRAGAGGHRECVKVTKYVVIVLLSPVNGVCCQIKFSASEKGFKNAWNGQAKTQTLDQLKQELSNILKGADWR